MPICVGVWGVYVWAGPFTWLDFPFGLLVLRFGSVLNAHMARNEFS